MNATEKYGAMMSGVAYGQLERHSSGEFIRLDETQQSTVACDLLDAVNSKDDECSTSEYLRRIGKGNLVSYAKTLQAGERRRARQNYLIRLPIRVSVNYSRPFIMGGLFIHRGNILRIR